MAKREIEVHVVIRNGLIESVYSEDSVNVCVYDLDSTDYDYQEAMEKEVKRLDDEYVDQGCTYIDGQDL